MAQTEYLVFFRMAEDGYELHSEVFAHSTIEAAENIANAETGEIGMRPRGAGSYIVVPMSRTTYHEIEETPRFRVKRDEDE